MPNGKLSLVIDWNNFEENITSRRNASVKNTKAIALTPGLIYFKYGPGVFPHEKWHDSPIILFSWWLNNWIETKKTRTDVFNSFMNGPCEVKVVWKTEEQLEVSFLKANQNKQFTNVDTVLVSVSHFEDMLFFSAKRVVGLFNNNERQEIKEIREIENILATL